MALIANANDGDRLGFISGNYSFWRDATANAWPDWLQIDFNGSKTIDEIDVLTVQDNAETPAEPTEALTFSLHGLTGFDVQYWNGSAWITVPGGASNKSSSRISLPGTLVPFLRTHTSASNCPTVLTNRAAARACSPR